MPSLKSVLAASAMPLLLVVGVAPGGAAKTFSLATDSGLPDLLVDQVESTINIPDGDAAARSYIRIDVANVGQGAAGATTVTWTLREIVAETADGFGESAGFSASGAYDLNPIAALDGNSHTIYVGDYADGAPTPGAFNRYFIHVTVDPADAVDEADEGNNAFSGDAWGGEIAAS